MDRLKNPVYRHRALQVAIDAALVALAFYMAFRLRFLETEGGVPERYQDMLWHSIAFVVAGKLIVFGASVSTRSGGATSGYPTRRRSFAPRAWRR